MTAKSGENGFEHWQHAGCSFRLNDHIPCWLKFLPSSRISQMLQTLAPSFFGPGSPHNGPPTIKRSIRPPVPCFQHVWREFRGTIDDLARIVEVPVAMQQAPLPGHALIEGCRRVRGENMKGRRFYALLDRPLDRTIKDAFIIVVHAEDEATVDHDAKIVQTLDSHVIISIEILILMLLLQVRRAQCFETNK